MKCPPTHSSLSPLTAPHLAHHTPGPSQQELLTAPHATQATPCFWSFAPVTLLPRDAISPLALTVFQYSDQVLPPPGSLPRSSQALLCSISFALLCWHHGPFSYYVRTTHRFPCLPACLPRLRPEDEESAWLISALPGPLPQDHP